MKTNSVAFSTFWGLSIPALVPLIVGTQFVNTPVASAATAATGAGPVLDRTIYIESAPDRYEMGYEGYTLSPDGDGLRVEVVGSERHEGTIIIDGDENSLTFTTTRDTQTRVVELLAINEEVFVVNVDGEPAIVLRADDNNEVAVTATLVPYLSADDPIDPLDIFVAVLGDENFMDEGGEYLAAVGGIKLIVAIVALIVSVLILGSIHAWNLRQHKQQKKNQCQNAHAGCQGACWHSGSVHCQNWVTECGGTPPTQEEIDECCINAAICDNDGGPQLQCLDWCETILFGCEEQLCGGSE